MRTFAKVAVLSLLLTVPVKAQPGVSPYVFKVIAVAGQASGAAECHYRSADWADIITQKVRTTVEYHAGNPADGTAHTPDQDEQTGALTLLRFRQLATAAGVLHHPEKCAAMVKPDLAFLDSIESGERALWPVTRATPVHPATSTNESRASDAIQATLRKPALIVYGAMLCGSPDDAINMRVGMSFGSCKASKGGWARLTLFNPGYGVFYARLPSGEHGWVSGYGDIISCQQYMTESRFIPDAPRAPDACD